MLDFLLPIINKAVDLIPDVNLKEKVKLELINQANELNLSQLKVNEQEASHKSLFVAGWRPMIGWICALALAYNYLLQPIIIFFNELMSWGVDITKLQIDDSMLMNLLFGMLGMSGMRTFEKIKGVARQK